MNYETFKQVVKQHIKEYIPENLGYLEPRFFEKRKVNELLDAVCFENPKDRAAASPTLYINDMYERYQEIDNIDYVLKSTMEKFQEVYEHGIYLEDIVEKNGFEQNVIFQLINTEQNKELLEDLPHREFQDLSVIYRWMLEHDKLGTASFIIHNDMAEQMGVNEEKLYELAYENTKRIFPPVVRTMREVVAELMFGNDAPEELVDMMFEDEPTETKMYIISNAQKVNGAVSMLYKEEFQELANELEDDLLVMPSSVHELIAVKAGGWDVYELAAMVEEINMEQVNLCDRLSNQVYCFDRGSGELQLATDTPSKRLDGKVAERTEAYAKQERGR